MTPLPHSLNRTVVIRATPATVFKFFTDSSRWAQWWGAGSTIDARPGGTMKIRYPNGVEASGEVLEVVAPTHVVFTMGYATGNPMPPGASRVSIKLAPHAEGTRLDLVHEFENVAVRDEHVQGWRYQLSLFGNVVANEVNAGVAKAIDRWFELWSVTDAGTRERTLREIATSGVRFRDRFSMTDGIDDLVPHIGAAQRFMPGFSLKREGDVRHCQGTAVADWAAGGPDGRPAGTGTNVFVLAPDGKIEVVTGLWR
ncbi:MAG TPA: SRPBCC domain-containing protein [Vicinamibacterales bacterium]|nr:SRPBCC domain-containing protein [Vicinamibacterales bacterium]